MADGIDRRHISVQIEDSHEDNYVVDGIANSYGRYNLPLFVTPVVINPMKANKYGNQSLGDGEIKITGWSVASGFTSTNIVNNALVATQTGKVRIVFKSSISVSFASVRFQIKVNGKVVQAGSGSGSISKVILLSAGDIIEVYATKAWHQTGWWLFSRPPAVATVNASGTSLAIEDYVETDFDFEEDMVYGAENGWYDDAWGRYVSPTYNKSGLPFVTEAAVSTNSQGFNTIYLTRGSVSGPILAQSRYPIPVIAGSKVNFSGNFRVRKTGSKDEQTASGTKTGINVRFSLWCIGLTIDEYGVESIEPIEVMFYMSTLQAASSSDESMMEYTLPTIPDATIPAGMTGMYFTCSLVYTADSSYGAGTFSSKTSAKDTATNPPKSPGEMRYFGWSNANPLKIKVELPSTMNKVTEHPLSRTGFAFRGRKLFQNVKPGASITFFGFPGAASTINIYNYNGAKQDLIGTFSSVANTANTVTVNPSGSDIWIESTGDYFIESVSNPSSRSFTSMSNQIAKKTYSNIDADITKISIKREEAGTTSATIDFSSENMDPSVESSLLRNSLGKEIRILGLHYGDDYTDRPAGWSGDPLFDELLVGKISKTTAKYDYKNEPIVQVIVQSGQDRMSRMKTGAAFYDFSKYGQYFNRSGMDVLYRDFNWGGPVRASLDKYLLEPEAHGDFTFLDALVMTRNSNKMYFYVNAKNQLIITDTLSHTGVHLSDDPVDTATDSIGYGKYTRKSDTQNVINQIITDEKALDTEDYKDRSLSADRPPDDLRYPSVKSQSGTHINEESANMIGTQSKTFPVIRRVESMHDLFYGKIGPGYKEWANELLSVLSNFDASIDEVNIPVRNNWHVYKVSQIDLLGYVTIKNKGTEEELKVRAIEHTIIPGKWFCTLSFAPNNQATYW